jgi:hypothetical protein
MKSRAKYLREITQKRVIETKQIEPLLKPYLDNAMMIFKEFTELALPKEECQDWLYDRYEEVRQLMKAALKKSSTTKNTKAKGDQLS